ncbi:MAG: TauD/TfdA family dioxygenase [Pseudomonadota bacterium]
MLQNNMQPGARPYLDQRQQALESLEFKHISLRRLSPIIGAEISSVDLENLSAEQVEEIGRARLAFRVLFFRGQDISAEAHLHFARRFGELEEHPFIPSASGEPEIVRFEKDKQAQGVENVWHSDVSWREVPSLGSVLRAHEIPEVGGDTLFSDMVAAYECLDEETRELIADKTAVHDFTQSFGFLLSPEELAERQKEFPAVEHPVVRTCPETGEKSLYVNRPFTSHILGMEPEQSTALIDKLCRQADVPEFQCRFRWEPNSIAFWDNRLVQHYAANDYWPRRRVMDRVTIIGERPH